MTNKKGRKKAKKETLFRIGLGPPSAASPSPPALPPASPPTPVSPSPRPNAWLTPLPQGPPTVLHFIQVKALPPHTVESSTPPAFVDDSFLHSLSASTSQPITSYSVFDRQANNIFFRRDNVPPFAVCASSSSDSSRLCCYSRPIELSS
jgi:hypothetical protein